MKSLREKLIIGQFELLDIIRKSESEEDCAVKIYEAFNRNIEALEASAVRVYQRRDDEDIWCEATSNSKRDELTALLICIEPTNQAVSKDEIKKVLSDVRSYDDEMTNFGGSGRQPLLEARELLARIEKFGIKGE